MVADAELIMKELKNVEEKLIQLHLGQSKKIQCQFCEHKGRSIIEERNMFISYLVVLIFLVLLGWYGILLAPFIMGILRQHIHRCPKCLNAIKEKSIFSSLEDNILSLQIGKFGVLIKRRTLAQGLAAIVLGFGVYYSILWSYSGVQHANYHVDKSIHWSNFIRECGKGVPIEAARKVHQAKYQDKIVQWEGHVMRIDGSENNYQHQATVLLVMNPRDLHPSVPEFAQREPDLIMTFDIHAFSRNKVTLEMLKRGDVVTFNATLPQMALKRSPSNAKSDQSLTKYHNYDEESIHHIHGLDLVYQKSDGPESVGEHIHWDGRYQFNEELAKEDFSSSQIQEETQQKFQNARDEKN